MMVFYRLIKRETRSGIAQQQYLESSEAGTREGSQILEDSDNVHPFFDVLHVIVALIYFSFFFK